VRKKPNAWHQAIVDQLSAAGTPLRVAQIWKLMNAAGFQHASRKPRATLGARIAELAQMKVIAHVGPGTYQIVPGASLAAALPEPVAQSEAS